MILGRVVRLLRIPCMALVVVIHAFLVGCATLTSLLLFLLPFGSLEFVLSVALVCFLLTYGAILIGASVLGQAFAAGVLLVAVACAAAGRLLVSEQDARFARAFLERHAGGMRQALLSAALVVGAYAGVFRTAPLMLCTCVGAVLLLFYAAWPKAVAGTRKRPSWKAALGSAALFLLSSILALCLFEGGARLLFGRPDPLPYVVHPTRLFTHGANASGSYVVHQGPEDPIPVPFTLSSQGLRGPVYGPKRPDEFRILMLGDSFTFGAGVRDHETIPYLLQGLLNEKTYSKRITVINAGVGGYGPWQERDFLDEIAGAMQPDLVILQLFLGNDVNDSLQRVDKHLRSHNLGETRLRFFQKHAAVPAVQTHQWLYSYSAAYRLFWRASDGPFRILDLLRQLRFLRPRVVPRVALPEDRPFVLEVNLKEWYPELEEGWALMQEDIRGIADACAEYGADIMVFAVPIAQTVNAAFWRDWVAEDLDPLYDRDKDVDLVEQFLRQLRISTIPVRDRLREHENSETLYYRYDGHLTAAGVRIVAEAMAEFLSSKYLPGRIGQ